jgi:hypothetical protein
MRRLSVLLLCAACGSAQHPAPVDPAAAHAAVEKLVAEQYDGLRRGDSDLFLRHADPDGWMMGIVHSRRTPEFLAELHKAIDPMVKRGVKMDVTSSGLKIGVSPDGHAAWVTDELAFAVTMGEQTMNMTQRFTEILGEKDGTWWVLADHMSAAARSGAGEPEAVPDGVGPGAAPIVQRLDELLADPPSLLHAISSRDDVGLFDPEGRLDAKALLEHGLPKLARMGGARAGLAPGGQLGWVACNVKVGEGDEHKPVRLLIAFLHEADGWKIVSLHVSLVPEMG